MEEQKDLGSYSEGGAPSGVSVPSTGWQDISTAPKDGTKVDLWMEVYACAITFGMSDEFRVPDCWFVDGYWVHDYGSTVRKLRTEYLTHWAPIQQGPAS